MRLNSDISSQDSNGPSWKAFCTTLLEDWREENFPERDGLHGETEGDNVRHLIVRATFLDYFFGDPKIKAAIQDWLQRTPLKQQAQEMSRTLIKIGDLAGITWDQIGWDEDTGFRLPPGVEAIPIQYEEEANAVVRSFLFELRAFSDSDVLGTVISEVVPLLESLDLGYQWLAIELLQVYFANLFVDDFCWQYTDKLDSETPDILAEEMTFVFSTQEGETKRDASCRFRDEVALAIEGLERYQRPLPRGTLPKLNRTPLKKYARWFYLNSVVGQSIRSIAEEEFPEDEDRRKDIRGGIKRVRDLLDLGRRDVPYPQIDEGRILFSHPHN